MIPTMTIETPPSPPRRHAYYTTPITKVTSLEDFLALTSQTLNIQSPLPPKEESITQPWPFEVAKDKEPSQDSLAFSKQPRCIEGGKYVVRKQEILIPTAKRQYESPKKRESGGEKIFKQHKAQFGYKRVDYTKSLLNTDVYEATDRDIKFLSELNKEILNGCPEVTSSQFEKIVEAWEHQTQENPPIPLDQALLFATGSIDVTIEDTPTLTKIYEYWKESRDHYRRPLLRKYWKAANTELANPNIAFQRRLENRFSRRRSQRMSSPQDDLKRMKTLKKNMNTSLLLMANVRYKEMLKRDLHQAKMKIFEEQLKEELGKDLEASVEGELQIPPPTFDLGLEQTSYCEEKRKMQEYMKKGEVMLKSLKRIKQGALTPTKKTFKKHSINSVDTSSSILQEELPPVIFRPMPFGLTKLTNYLPRNIQGSFTLPMKKCSIELNDLKEKLKQSLGGLYKKDQEELQVKVDVEDSIDEPPKEQEDSPKSASDLCEELVIRIQMEEHTVKQEEGEVAEAPATTVKYNIKFNEKYPNKSPSLDMASKGSLKLGVSFQIKGNFNVPPIDTSKFLSKELVKPIIKSKEGLSAGKNASGEGDIHV